MNTIQTFVQDMPWNKKIAILRLAKGWSQEKAANECGTTKKNYWIWESGKKYPRFNNRRCIAIAFGVPMIDIFGDISEKNAI